MCSENLHYYAVEEGVLIVVSPEHIESKKDFRKLLKINFRKPRMLKNPEKCRKVVDVRFDLMLENLISKHDWKRFPVCSLSRIKTEVEECIYGEWRNLEGELGSQVTEIARCKVVPISSAIKQKAQSEIKV